MWTRVFYLSVVLLCVRPALAQQPAQLPALTPPATPLEEALVSFDPLMAEVRWMDGRWELHAGNLLLKDFGAREAEAREALRLIRLLHLTQRGSVGSPRPIMEYWLTDGRAPLGWGVGGMRLQSIDQASLRVESMQGQWCVRDEQRVLLSFGCRKEEAERAAAIIRQYGFTQVGCLGQPLPTMMCFLGQAGPQVRSSLSAPPLANEIQPIKFEPTPGADGQRSDPAAAGMSAQLQQRQLAAIAGRQLAPPSLDPPGVLRFEPNRIVVRRDAGVWKLLAGEQTLASFGLNQQLAFQALSILQSYHFDEQHTVGTGREAFSYFLANGQAPRGIKLGVSTQAFAPDRVSALRVGNCWVIADDSRSLLSFGDRENDARKVLDAIRRYQFDHLCRLGINPAESLTFFIRSR